MMVRLSYPKVREPYEVHELHILKKIIESSVDKDTIYSVSIIRQLIKSKEDQRCFLINTNRLFLFRLMYLVTYEDLPLWINGEGVTQIPGNSDRPWFQYIILWRLQVDSTRAKYSRYSIRVSAEHCLYSQE